MFDLDTGKLLIIGVVALVVIGPKDLPQVLRQVGQAVARLRRMAGEFQGQFMEAVREADLQDLRKEVEKIKDTAALDVSFDPARDVQAEIVGAVEKTQIASPAIASDTIAASDVADPAREVAVAPALPLIEGGPQMPAAAVPVHATSFPGGSPTQPETPKRKIAAVRRRDGSRIVEPRSRVPGAAYRPRRAARPDPGEPLDR